MAWGVVVSLNVPRARIESADGKSWPHPERAEQNDPAPLEPASTLGPKPLFYLIVGIGTMQVGLASFVSKTRSPEGFLHPEWSESFQGWHDPGKSSKAPSCLRQAKLIGIAPKIILDLSQINPALPASS
jgi:hypothetical protein